MIDTFMALWNQGSQNRGARILFTFSLICISISLLLVTIIIPGWILFSQNNNSLVANSATPASTLPTDTVATMTVLPTPTAPTTGSSSSRTTLVGCSTPSPLPGPKRSARISPSTALGNQPPPVPPVAPPVALIQPTTGAKVLVVPHRIYSGRPSGAVSHLQRLDHVAITPTVLSTRTAARSNPTPVPTPTPRPTPVVRTHTTSMRGAFMRAHAVFIRVQSNGGEAVETSPAPVTNAPTGPVSQSISDKCLPTGQSPTSGLGLLDRQKRAPGLFAAGVLGLGLLSALLLISGRERERG